MTHDKQDLHDESVIESGVIGRSQHHPAGNVVEVHTTKCCLVGSGPAGVVLSYLLTRQGVPVFLHESHKGFDRNFRGDTIHASVLELMDDLGLSSALHQIQHVNLHGPTIQTRKGPSVRSIFVG